VIGYGVVWCGRLVVVMVVVERSRRCGRMLGLGISSFDAARSSCSYNLQNDPIATPGTKTPTAIDLRPPPQPPRNPHPTHHHTPYIPHTSELHRPQCRPPNPKPSSRRSPKSHRHSTASTTTTTKRLKLLRMRFLGNSGLRA
jgi:hypothetical protein